VSQAQLGTQTNFFVARSLKIEEGKAEFRSIEELRLKQGMMNIIRMFSKIKSYKS
jgi:hypothetical protein